MVHPLDGRRIPIITDAELVDMDFGTGAVKITPAHDPNDFAAGKRHGLQFLNILTNEGTITAAGGQFCRPAPLQGVVPTLPFTLPRPQMKVTTSMVRVLIIIQALGTKSTNSSQ